MDVEEYEDMDLIEVRAGEHQVVGTVGISASGTVYVAGDLHPLGSATALIRAAQDGVPYVAVSAVEVLYPAEWLRGECLHDGDRQRVIAGLERVARTSARGSHHGLH